VQTSGAWQQEQKLYPTPAVDDISFGWAVLLNSGLLAVSAPTVVQKGPRGQVFLFEQSAGSWKSTSTMTARYPAEADLYGGSIARLGTTLVVGANGESSGATGIDGDASRTDAYQSGAAFVYTSTDGHTWIPTTYLKAATPDADDVFGLSTALTESRVVVGAPFEGSASRMVNGDAANNGAARSGAAYIFR
jgi:hypothetical protein